MDEGCRYCEKWKEKRRKFEEHFYWGHVDAKRMHFSKSMIGDFSKCMIIPKKFIEHFTGELLETIELKVPSGDIWHVELKKTNDGVILDCGWKNFVEAHDIQQNDTLIFKYDGFSSFLVLMFDPSGCEKATSHCAKKKYPMHGSCSAASVKLGGHNSNLSSYRYSEQAQAITEVYENPRANGSAEEKSVKMRRNFKRNYVLKDLLVGSRKKKALKEQVSGAIKAIKNPDNEVSSDQWCRPNVFIVARKAGLRDEEKNRLFSFAEIIHTDRPSFVSIMVPCSVVKRFYMTVPIAFALAHLPRTSSTIVLQIPDKDRLWQVQCYVQPHSVGFTTGWKKFVHNNRLKVGDICFFELVEIQKDVLMNVYINRF